MQERDAILICHHFFDFKINDWIDYWQQGYSKQNFPKRIGHLRPQHKKLPSSWQEASAIATRCYRNLNWERITILDSHYPCALQILEFPPPVLYKLGAKIPESERLISVVGTRKISSLGRQASKDFCEFFCESELGIISGLAKGVDSVAHQTCVQQKSYTLAILGSSLDYIYPRQNQKLAAEILAQQGTLLSQFPYGTRPYPYNFPRRNYLIAALSTGCVVIEGSRKSGAAITGKAALEIGRTCVCLPQNFNTEYGKGAIELINAGAQVVSFAHEAVAAIGISLGGCYGKILSKSGTKRSLSFEQIQTKLELETDQAIAKIQTLTDMEIIEARANASFRLTPAKPDFYKKI